MSATTRAMSAERGTDVSNLPQDLDHSPPRNLEDALNFFNTLDSSNTMRGNIKLHLAVDEVVKHSMSGGLESEQIILLVDVILNPTNKLSQAVRSKFVKCLIPARKVPQDAVIKVVSSISAKIFTSPGPSNLHSLLLRWILLVFDHLDGYDRLHKLYNIIFSFINSHRLLPQACHLLFLLTTKHDVRLFRVHKLLELIKAVGPEPYILGVLMIYKVYCPHLVTVRLDYGHKVFFKTHDATWRSTIAAVVKQREESEEGDSQWGASEIKCRRERARIQPRSKRQKLMVPTAHSAAHEVEAEEEEVSGELPDVTYKIPYTQIESFTEFLEAVDRIEYPSQMAACLTESRLQLLLTCNPEPLVMTRLCFWIQHLFAFGFKVADKDCKARNEQLLQMLYTFASNVQGLPVVLCFLESFLPTWDGHSYAPLIFSLISCVRPCSYDDLYMSILEPLHRIFFTLDVYGKTMCITALTRLIQNFALEEKSREKLGSQAPGARPSSEEECESNSATKDGGYKGDNPAEHSRGMPEPISTMDTIYRLISFLDTVLVVGMRMEDDHYLLQSSGLDILQLISEICQKYDIPLVCLPVRLIHRLLLSDCPATLARLCGIINQFREAFTTVRSEVTRGEGLSMTCDTINQISGQPEGTGTEKFNSLLLDVLGMLWQGRMFSDRKHKYKSMFKFPLPSQLQGQLKGNELTVYRGPAFQGLAYKFLKETQREDKRTHPAQIEEFKEIYLQFLDRENFPEFLELVNINIKRRKGRT